MHRNVIIATGACLGIAAVYGIAGCGSSGGSSSTPTPPPAPSTQSIDVVNDAAAPMGFAFTSPVTVKAGTMVTWVNQTAAPHGITWNDNTPASSPTAGANIPIFSGGTTSAAWTAPAQTVNTEYDYYCTVHGKTMAGIINVTP
jgi:plastocyanin